MNLAPVQFSHVGKISAFNKNFPTEAPTPQKWSPKKKFQGAHESPQHSS